MVRQALRGQVLPLAILGGYVAVCAVAYFGYAARHSVLNRQALEVKP
jgi:hypothetical protein